MIFSICACQPHSVATWSHPAQAQFFVGSFHPFCAPASSSKRGSSCVKCSFSTNAKAPLSSVALWVPSSSKADIRITTTPGSSFVSWEAASNPVISGILTSIRTKSGTHSCANTSASRPLRLFAITSTFDRMFRKAHRASTKSAESSTTKVRIRVLPWGVGDPGHRNNRGCRTKQEHVQAPSFLA